MVKQKSIEEMPKALPTSKDFTQTAIKKAIINTATNHWTVRYALPSFAGTAIIGGLFGFSYPVFLTMIGIAAGSTLSFAYNTMFKGETFEHEYVKTLHKIIDEHTLLKRNNLKEDLLKNGGKRGSLQLEQFDHKFEILVEVLNQKFDESQLTYQRYYSIAKEVYLSGIDNLNSILIALKTIKSIDLQYIEFTLDKIKDKDRNNMAVKKEQEALLRSKESYKLMLDKVENLLAENELALTQIEQTTIAISDITRSKNSEAQIDMENSMNALEEMAMRSNYYSR